MPLTCDLETGICAPSSLAEFDNTLPQIEHADIEFIYIGDPMCSWCWGVSKTVKDIQSFSTLKGIKFSVIVGGLRPGGGDKWTDQFKAFLRREWQHIQKFTEQPFSFKLLDRESFNYDTEPACRAVVTAREILSGKDVNDLKLLPFFSAIQYKFYVAGEDPSSVEFYRDLCEKHNIDFGTFSEKFSSAELQKETFKEFQLNRSWGVHGFPSFALRKGNEVTIIGSGHIELHNVLNAINAAIATKQAQAK
ncbi:DsbA family protein [Acinetobacter nosocomialis]|uniref:DsbA family protein n=1 Tax=Acinetobacter nosocomialis TaxID=106654 RepID=UPI0025A27873|nr:hypothetical protein [Acinetobacter nosocomialis]